MQSVVETMTTETKTTSQYFAVQIHRYETNHELAEVVLRKANDLDILFKELEVMDRVEIGSTIYMRCKVELESVESLMCVFREAGRNTVSASFSGYILKFANSTRTGPIAFSVMNVVSRTGSTVTYRGTRIKHWERQFLKDGED